MPTLLDIADIDIPEGVEGRSLVPLIDGSVELSDFHEWHEVLAVGGEIENGGRAYSIFNGVHRLIIEGDRKSLYDVVNDPRETKDIAAGNPRIVEHLYGKASRISIRKPRLCC